MATDDKIRDEKSQSDINREAAKMALSSRKIDKYEYEYINNQLKTNNRTS